MRLRSCLSAVFTSLLIACAACTGGAPSSGSTDLGSTSDSGAPPSQPITAPANTWTWVDIDGAVCDDGTPTGIGVNPAPAPDADVVVYFFGGGACWDYNTCAVLNTSTHGPYGRAQFEAQRGGFAGSILDNTVTLSPFYGAHIVLVPYCTGDLHAGDNVATYVSGAQQRIIHHRGRSNAQLLLRRLVATWPTPRKLVLSGSSAGGYGATLNYDLYRTAYSAAAGYLIDDSGPLLVGDAIPKSLRDAWYPQWALARTLGSICPGCPSDLSLIYPALQVKYPSDRMSLLSYTQDGVIRAYFNMQTTTQFQTNLYQLGTSRFDPSPRSRVFFIAGDKHGLFGTPTITSQGTSLLTFLKQQVTDAQSWASVRP